MGPGGRSRPFDGPTGAGPVDEHRQRPNARNRADDPSEERSSVRVAVDPRLATTVVGCPAIVLVAGLVQVSVGAYSMTLGRAWGAVFDPDTVLSRQA